MQNSFWQRIRFKFRVSVLNESTLIEVWHIRLSRAGLILLIAGLFIFTFALIALLIWFTPINRYLPGYNANLRQDIVEQVVRVDSLNTQLEKQQQYLMVVKNILAGEVSTDTVESLDSLALVQREQLLEARNAVTQEFIDQYEQKERDQLTLFDVHSSLPQYTLFRPVRGVVKQTFNPDNGFNGALIETPNNEPVAAVLTGTVIAVVNTMATSTSVFIQHDYNIVSVYHNLADVKLTQGSKVEVGTLIGRTSKQWPFIIEIWVDGKAINPENMINF